MPIFDNNRIAWTYTDDDGTAWRISAKKEYTDQLVGGVPILGGAPAASSVRRIPKELKVRKRKLTSGNNVYWVPVYNVAADAWLEAPTAPHLNVNVRGVDTEMTFGSARRAEKYRDTTTQNA